MSQEIIDAAVMYVTDRPSFDTLYGETLHKSYLDMLFLRANTRPEIAETVTMVVLGYTPITKKHDYDGLNGVRKVEAKVRTNDSQRLYEDTDKARAQRARTGFATVTINDPSRKIIEKYDRDNPEFILPYFVDGHLVACIALEWSNIRPFYDEEVTAQENGKRARAGVSLTPRKYIEKGVVVWTNSSPEVLDLLPTGNLKQKVLGLPLKFKKMKKVVSAS